MNCLLQICALAVLVVSGVFIAVGRSAEPIPFERDVAPILEERCVRCHSTDKPKGGLSFTTKAEFWRGGDSGAVVVSERPDESLLIEMVTGPKPQMPAEGTPLSAGQLNRLKNWIAAGAAWPDGVSLKSRTPAGAEWWSFQPIRRPALPAVSNSTWSRNEIDLFILVKLQQSGLGPSTEADRRTLIRRLAFDLLGLPPTHEQIQAFEADPDPAAYDRLVEQLLESPHYGERWARHWLDVAHYADTHGFERDQRRDNAWRYRDWVIKALNADLPYNQFLRDQIAGDVSRPDDPDAVIATGFLAAGPWDFVGQAETPSPVLKRLARADDLDDMVTQVMTAACGVTVNCARCHDHKLDPISQQEYYGLWAVFAGVKRGEREISTAEVRELATLKQSLTVQLQQVRAQHARLSGRHYDLADIVGGGDGLGSGKPGEGIDPASGNPQTAKRGVLEGAKPNEFARSKVRFIDGVVIPDLCPEGTTITSTGLKIMKPPRTSGQVWDAIRYGPVNSQHSTELGGTDYAGEGHTLLSLHANAAITFDLAALRDAGAPAEMKLTATAGYFGKTPRNGARFSVYVDGQLKADGKNIGRDDGAIAVDVGLPETARFLTLMATDGGNGISHDQICFADAWLLDAHPQGVTDETMSELVRLQQQRTDLEKRLANFPTPKKVYAVLAEQPPPINVLVRGDPEQPTDEVPPQTLRCLTMLNPQLSPTQASDSERRKLFADWVTSAANPLTRRVIVNRLWHHHFGVGLVETPSDFGAGGSLPSHPELLDWLSDELASQRWSPKAIHRLIVKSATYRQQSSFSADDPRCDLAHKVDAGNRLLWRMSPRRLDAESFRDAVLSVSGKLNATMFGAGYRDFEYQEEYAPVYRYITPDSPELWRRSIYRFAVRTTTHQFLTTLDCPSPANLAPVRSTTTTALQSLVLLNNEFMLRQCGYFADRVATDAGSDVEQQVIRAFQLAFGRLPSDSESSSAVDLVQSRGLRPFCRMLLNANEFVYVD